MEDVVAQKSPNLAKTPAEELLPGASKFCQSYQQTLN